jgi:sulfur-oxidizing protein SoxZ
MVKPALRVKLPKAAKRGEIVEIMTLISHPMDTGLRKDKDGKLIPRKIINEFFCIYNGDIVFRTNMYEAISANPLIQFTFIAKESGSLDLFWHEDGGEVYTTVRKIKVY